MAHVLQIIHGNTTISFTSGTNDVTQYAPKDSGRDVVTEKLVVNIEGAAVTDIKTTLESVMNAFRLANRRYDNQHGDRVYVKFQPNGYTSAYRSELVRPQAGQEAGSIDYDDGVLGINWVAKRVEATITWTRKNYWEDFAESELSIANGSGSGTGGQTIYNIHGAAVFSEITVSFAEANSRISDSGSGFGIFAVGDIISLRGSTINDGVYSVAAVAGDDSYIDVNEVLSDEAAGDTVEIYDVQNYVHIASGAIAGDLDAAIRLEVTNSDAGDSLETLWAGLNNLSAPAAFPHLLEVGDSDTGSDSADAAFANGIKRTYTITTSEAKVTAWTLSSEVLTSADGGYFKVFVRCPDVDLIDVKWRLKLKYSSTVIWEGEQIEYDDTYATIARAIRAIDTVQLPPYMPENSVPTDLTLELWGVSTSGGSESVDLDCLILMPLDGYRRLRSTSGIAQNSILKDDGITGTYYQEVSSEQVRDIAVTNKQLMIDPSENNRIYFLLHSEVARTADYNRVGSVKVYYRARKVSL